MPRFHELRAYSEVNMRKGLRESEARQWGRNAGVQARPPERDRNNLLAHPHDGEYPTQGRKFFCGANTTAPCRSTFNRASSSALANCSCSLGLFSSTARFTSATSSSNAPYCAELPAGGLRRHCLRKVFLNLICRDGVRHVMPPVNVTRV